MVVYSPPLPFPEIKSEAFKSQLPQSFDSTQPVKIEDDTLTGFPFGENYENTAVPGPIRPKRLAVERFNESFTTVLGKLALSNAKEHKMTVGELHRRVNGPEALHSSLLLGLMRTGKGKVKGELLRAKLMDYGIVLHHGQRKTKNSTMFTSLCESEARNLAVDFTGLCLMEGSAEEIGKEPKP